MLKTREGTVMVFAVAMVLAIAALSYTAWSAFDRGRRQLQITQHVVSGTDEILSALKDAETGQRGFLLTGDERYLKPYRSGVNRLPAGIAELDSVAAERPEQHQRLDRLHPLIRQKLQELEETISLRRSGNVQAALAIVRTDRGEASMDEIRRVCLEIQSVANERLRRFSDESRSSANSLGVVATAGSAALCIFLISAGITIQRGISRRQALIADLRASELRYRESRDWLDTTLRSIGDGVIATGADGRIVFLNPVAASLTGWTQEEAAGQPVDNVIAIHNEETGAEVDSPVGKVLREGRIVGLANHTVLTAKDGRRIPIDDSAGPIRGEDGKTRGVVMVFRDVTERKQTELELQTSAERLRSLLRATPIGVLQGDVHGGVHYVNDAFLAITGYSQTDFEGGRVNWKSITPPEHLALDARGIAEAKERGTCTPYEKEYIRKDGSRVPVYVGYSLIGEAREESVAFILDLTDRKRAEQQSTRQLRRLVESNIVGIVVANEHQVLNANDVYLDMLGYSRQDLVEGRVDWVKATPPDSLKRDEQGFRELRARGVCVPYEKEYIRSDGTLVPILIGAAALDGFPELTWICFVVDLTSQKALQQELKVANARLSRANEELERFAYVVSHDLQSPLRTISSMTTMLARRFEPYLDDDSRKMAAFVESSVKHMSRMIGALLDYSRLTTDSGLKTRPIDCAALFAMTTQNLETQICETGAKVTAGPLPVVQADDQLGRVFQNLIENALKYRGERAPEIRVSAERSSDGWIISVADNGIGFDMKHAQQIFTVFHRLHTGPGYQGLGIGLAVCKRTIERYGGRLWVESAEGAGAKFYFSVPAADRAADKSAGA